MTTDRDFPAQEQTPGRSRRRIAARCAITFTTGALSVLAWAPFGWYLFALFGYAILFQALKRSRTVLQAALTGAAFGAGLHFAGHHWVFSALHGKAGLGGIAAAFSTLLYVGYLAAFTALPCALYGALVQRGRNTEADKRRWPCCLAFAGLMTAGEWARTLFFNGFTSLSLGYSLIDTWLSGLGPVTGMVGISWAGFLIASLLSTFFDPGRSAKRSSRYGVLITSFCIFCAGWLAQQLTWTQPYGQPISYRLIQSNIRQAVKFDPRLVQQHARRVADIIVQKPSDVIMTPETAFPMFLNELPGDLLPALHEFARRSQSHVFLGIATSAANSDGYNSMLQLSPDMASGQMARYDKVRLMPFGEYTPAGFGWFTRSLSIPLKDLSAGTEHQAPFTIPRKDATVKIGTLICHEDLVGSDARDRAQSGNIIFNPSNLSWFDGTLAVGQRLQIVRMRALEVGRPVLRIANTGITAEIGADGRVVRSLDPGVDGVLEGKVQPLQGLTPYTRNGDASILIIVLLGVFISIAYLRRHVTGA